MECGSWLDFKSRADQPALVTYKLNSIDRVFHLRAVKDDAVYVYQEPLWSETPETSAQVALGETEKGIDRRIMEKRLECGLAYSVSPKLLKREGRWITELEYRMDPNYVKNFISIMLRVPKEKVTHEETVPPEELKPEPGLMVLEQLENERTIALESIRLLEQQLDEVRDRRRELGEELDRISLLESTLQPLKEKYVEKLREADRAIYRRFGVELEKPKEVRQERAYPAQGIFTVGFLLAFIGLLFLFSVEAPLTIKYILGAGFLLVGFFVLIGCFTRLRRKRAAPS